MPSKVVYVKTTDRLAYATQSSQCRKVKVWACDTNSPGGASSTKSPKNQRESQPLLIVMYFLSLTMFFSTSFCLVHLSPTSILCSMSERRHGSRSSTRKNLARPGFERSLRSDGENHRCAPACSHIRARFCPHIMI
ncbi:uncharacterized protein BT62DRAFT_62573 [Guyanagaster necrorhizus]|uniref:Uncharacterized protein n=1 Tax=Guyanagaster necrorhizus TaxID=856835 RepID=A0A9P8AT66_9AGAR|nr:uncharacterized protein BT62DRAFT_62573 [Guyanagaster necrorhizus MCA 3950]KAG7447123.1 hypothetical protein BT62DRAFT_62573 [Guyanagaster necrorhizus MCA 3950]